MADWSSPTITTLYTTWPTALKSRDDASATMFNDGVTWTNLPTNAVRWYPTNDRFERWTGATWVNLSSSLTDTLKIGNNLSDLGDVAAARSNLQLGSLALIASPLPLANGGTGATTLAGAQTALGIGSMGTQSANSVSITGGVLSGITALTLVSGSTISFTTSGTLTGVTLAQTAGDIHIKTITADYWVYLGANGTDRCYVSSGAFAPTTNGTYNLGGSGNQWNGLYAVTVNAANYSATTDLTFKIAGTAYWIMGASGKEFRPNGNQTQELGTSSYNWQTIWGATIRTDLVQRLTGVDNAYLQFSSGTTNLYAQANINMYAGGLLKWVFTSAGQLVPFGAQPDYSTSGTSTQRSVTGSSTTTDVRNALATLIADLTTLGFLQ